MCACVYLFNRRIQGKFIGVFLCFTEDDGSAVAAAVDLDHIGKHSCTLWPVARNGQMLPRRGQAERQKDKQREREREPNQGGRRDIFINSAGRL